MTETPKVILLVEDHELMRTAIGDALERAFFDCRVICCASGEEGVALAHEYQPEVVVMDVGLPGMNGIDATRQIKALLPTTSIVMCSMSDDTADHVAAAMAGASEWVMKDDAFERLVPAIRRHLLNRRCLSEHSRDKNAVLKIAVETSENSIGWSQSIERPMATSKAAHSRICRGYTVDVRQENKGSNLEM